jgi:pilus assembly protein CpaE
MAAFTGQTESLGMGALSLVLIGPDEQRRRALAKAFTGPQAVIAREVSSYPDVDELAEFLALDHDAVIVDLDPNPERALDVVEYICAQKRSLTVMVYSARADSDLLVRCMRAGAREFLTDPVLPTTAAEALVRTSVRRDEVRPPATAAGKLLVFVGAKGGSGVTTVASNFAVALAQYGKVALIDLNLPLGDAALILGLNSKFTVLDALDNGQRLDSDFLSGLMARHASGLAVLSAPDAIATVEPGADALERLLHIARQDFAYVVVDGGSRPSDLFDQMFGMASTVYVVAQVGVTDLRNAHRFVTRYFSGVNGEKLEMVLNRYAPRNIEIDEAAVNKALTRPARWKIPNDFGAARTAQNTGIPLVSGISQVARALADMAAGAAGQAAPEKKKKKFSLFG